MEEKLDLNNLGFKYIKTDYRYVSIWENGKWDSGKLSTDNMITMSEGSTALHYGQTAFEGLKAYRTKDGAINLFRVDENAKRINMSCRKLLMPEIPTEKFVDACMQVVKANEKYIPPYGTGGTLYLRPFIIGVGDNLGVKAAPSYIFSVFCSPVGAYFKAGLKPCNFDIAEYDRAAPRGTGKAKVGGNYGASMLPHKISAEKGFADCIYLDPATQTKIDEVGAANFFGITKENVYVTPKSSSILESITNLSLMYIAEHYLHLKVEKRDVHIDNLDEFKEAGACGTAAVITPIGGIERNGKLHIFYSETEVGPIIKELYKILSGIQFGEIEPPKGWIFKVK